MVQEFQVLRCFCCHTFQVHQVKKSKKWVCKLCGENQSLIKVYGQGSGVDCRHHVQKLNLLQGEVEHTAITTTELDWQNEISENDYDSTQSSGSSQPHSGPPISCWSKYLEEDGENLCVKEEENTSLNYTDREHFYTPQNITSEVRKRKKKAHYACDFSKQDFRGGILNTFKKKRTSEVMTSPSLPTTAKRHETCWVVSATAAVPVPAALGTADLGAGTAVTAAANTSDWASLEIDERTSKFFKEWAASTKQRDVPSYIKNENVGSTKGHGRTVTPVTDEPTCSGYTWERCILDKKVVKEKISRTHSLHNKVGNMDPILNDVQHNQNIGLSLWSAQPKTSSLKSEFPRSVHEKTLLSDQPRGCTPTFSDGSAVRKPQCGIFQTDEDFDENY